MIVSYFSWLVGGLFGELVIPKYSYSMAWKILQPFVGLVFIALIFIVLGALALVWFFRTFWGYYKKIEDADQIDL